MKETVLGFGPFRLDLANEQLWQGPEALKLTGKAFAVLRYLVEHSEQLVTKEALFTAVWPETVVSDAALTVCVRELRRVLEDTAKPPHYIETVHGRGYRWIASLSPTPPVRSPEFGVRRQHNFQPAPNPQHLAPNTQAEVEEAEGYFLKAIEVARRQSAKSLELRATMSLSRLWREQGKQKQAHQMLAEIYNWFTEGFDTKDLQEAKALLEVLG